MPTTHALSRFAPQTGCYVRHRTFGITCIARFNVFDHPCIHCRDDAIDARRRRAELEQLAREEAMEAMTRTAMLEARRRARQQEQVRADRVAFSGSCSASLGAAYPPLRHNTCV